MKSSSWIKSLSGRVTRRAARRPSRRVRQLRLEVLEERIVLSGSPISAAAYGNLPLAFEVNEGQAAGQVDFLARGEGYMLSLTPGTAVLHLQQGAARDELQIQLVGANSAAVGVGQDELVTRTNYLIGSDPSQWHTNIANYGKVEYQNVYAGINLVYYGTNQGQLEYDFVVAPGADPGAIKLSIQGAQSIMLDAQGNLVLHTAGGDLVQHAPVIYQELDGQRQSVAGAFVLDGNNQFSFQIGTYDASRPLTIDPVLSYSTYLGGSSNDSGQAISVDSAGNAYITGNTYSANFHTTAGSPQGALGGNIDVFVAKLNPSGTALVYSTYLGGTYEDQGSAIAVDAAGNAYVTGSTASNNFPVTAGAFQQTNPAGWFKGFVAKLNSTGSALLFSTYLGGSGGFDSSKAIAVDGTGNTYVTGSTSSSDFPTLNPVQAAHADNTSSFVDVFVTKLNVTGTGLVYSTFLGGSGDDFGNGIAVDAAGNAYVTGSATTTHPTDPSWGLIAFPTTPGAFQTANASSSGVPFVTKLDSSGSTLAYSTFIGGTSGYDDRASDIAVDAVGNAYVTGSTQAADFPTTPGAFQRTKGGYTDAFVTELNANGSTLVYSTFLGGGNTDEALGIAVDDAGNAYVMGTTDSANFPTTANALQRTKGGGYDAFVTQLNGAGSALVHSTYLGGNGDDFGMGIVVDTAGNAYLVGETDSVNFPTTAGALQSASGGWSDAFVAKLWPALINDVSVTEGNSGTTTATFTVSRSGDTTQAASVDYATANGSATAGSDYIATSGTLTFAPGVTSLTISVAVNGDTVIEPDEVFYVNLSNASPGAGLSDGQGVGTILDDDTPPTKFYVVNDGSPDRTYEYGATGTALENYSLNTGNTAPRGVASNAIGTRIWVVDANKTVYVYDTSGGLLGSWTAGTLASTATPQGIATNGNDVWIVDSKSDKVFKYAGAATRLFGSQNAASSFSLNKGNTSPTDIVTDGASLWVTNDAAINKVFKYTVAGSLLGSWTIDAANATPTGITIDPANVSNVWIVDSGTDKVYQYTAAASRTSGSQAAAATFVLAAGNTNPQGIADPPPAGSLPSAGSVAAPGAGTVVSMPGVQIPMPSGTGRSSSLLTKTTAELATQNQALRGDSSLGHELISTASKSAARGSAKTKTVTGRLHGETSVRNVPNFAAANELDGLFEDWSSDPLQLLLSIAKS